MSVSSNKPINAGTRLCAVYGHPIRHSASPAMHNAAFIKLGLNWRYLAFDVLPSDLSHAIEGARTMRFVGLNLTLPHKVLALEYVDIIEPAALRWGAVNTLRFEGNLSGCWRPLAELPDDFDGKVRSHGFNTDADAIVRAIREDLGMEVRGARVLLAGAGGAGRTAALRLVADGVSQLFLVNRTEAKAAALASEVQAQFPGARVTLGLPPDPVDLVVNATSLGLAADDPSPITLERCAKAGTTAVYDMIYRPAETALLREARHLGCRAANGLGMLLHQGAAALELWCGDSPPLAEMRAALTETIHGANHGPAKGIIA